MPERPGRSGESDDDYSWLFESDEPARDDRRPDRTRANRTVGSSTPREQHPDRERTQRVPRVEDEPGGPSTRMLPTTGAPGSATATRPSPAASGGGGGRPPTGTGTLPPGPGGRGPRPAKRRHRARRVVTVLVTVLIAYLVFLVATPIWAWSAIGRIEASTGSQDTTSGTTFLVVGSDARSDMTPEQRKELGTGNADGQRTDSIMLLHVPSSGDPTLVSIPRDSYVDIPGHDKNKINAAFAFGGPKLLAQTVEQATGLHIDGYIEIGFVGFVDLVDAVGGVRVCVDEAIDDKDAHLQLSKGCHDLGGTKALGFVRARHSFARGDLDRVEHQRQVMAQVLKKAMSPSSLLPWRYWNLAHAGSESLTVGEDTSLLELVTFARAMKAISAGNGTTTTVPIADADYPTSAGSAVLWDEGKAAAFFADLRKG